MARAECSSALITEAYESESLVYLPTKAMEVCSRSRSDLWNKDRLLKTAVPTLEVLGRIHFFETVRRIQTVQTGLTSPSILWAFCEVSSQWASPACGRSSQLCPDSPGVKVLCRWRTRHVRRSPVQVLHGKTWRSSLSRQCPMEWSNDKQSANKKDAIVKKIK